VWRRLDLVVTLTMRFLVRGFVLLVFFKHFLMTVVWTQRLFTLRFKYRIIRHGILDFLVDFLFHTPVDAPVACCCVSNVIDVSK